MYPDLCKTKKKLIIVGFTIIKYLHDNIVKRDDVNSVNAACYKQIKQFSFISI